MPPPEVQSDVASTEHSASQRAWGLEQPGLGLSLGGAHATHDSGQVERQRDWVRLAESLGLHSVWLPEMHFAAGACPAPLVGLAEFVSLTQRLRLGTTSLLLPLFPAAAMKSMPASPLAAMASDMDCS